MKADSALAVNIVKFPKIDHIAIRYDGKVHSLPMPAEYSAIYESFYKQGLAPTPFDAEQGFLHPITHEFIDANDVCSLLCFNKNIGC